MASLKNNEKSNLGFWQSLNHPKYIVAPMVELSDLAFRLLCRNYNAELTYTPMLNSGQFLASTKYREFHFQTHQDDWPLIAQFCGNDPEILLQSALLIQDSVQGIDLNLGCPQGIAKKGNYGAFLLEQPQSIMKIISYLKSNLKVPVTCKIRKVSKDLQQTVNLCLELQSIGCDAICIHGRTKEQKAQLTDACDWEAIKIIKQRLSIPIIANGGIETFKDISKCLDYTGADAAMSAEGILDYPALFSGSESYSRINLAQEYLDLAIRYPPRSISCIRAHLFRILHGQLQIETHLRTQMAQAASIIEFSRILQILREIPSKEDIGYSWYRRYRKVEPTIEPQITPLYI